MILLIPVPGILDPAASPGWDQTVADYAAARGGMRVLREKRRVYPLPHWNHYVTNPRTAKLLARGVLQSIATMAEAGASYSRIVIIAHSNGTNIAVMLMARLAAAGVRVDGVGLIGSALHSDVERSGLLPLVEAGHLGRVVAWCSSADFVIRNRQSWPGPYGSLGSRGLQHRVRNRSTGRLELRAYGAVLHGPEAASIDYPFVTRWFAGYSHSEWTRPHRIRETFELALGDLGLAA